MKRVKVALLDSGVDINHCELYNKPILSVETFQNGESIEFCNSFSDENGHGTAMAGILFNKSANIELLSIKILNKDLKCSFRHLYHAMEYAIKEGSEVINLSLGTTEQKHQNDIENLCQVARSKGIYIVSAFHNRGIVSYPASIPYVFGVKGKKIFEKYGYILSDCKNNIIYANGDIQKVVWKDNGYAYKNGNSYASANFAGILAHLLMEGSINNRDSLMEHIAKYSLSDKTIYKTELSNTNNEWIKRALVFPVSNENISMIVQGYPMDHHIIGFYDTRKYYFDYLECETKVGRIRFNIFNNLEEGLSNADTLLIGDLSHIPAMVREDTVKIIIKKAIGMEKNVYLKDYLPIEDYEELYATAREKNITIQSKYL